MSMFTTNKKGPHRWYSGGATGDFTTQLLKTGQTTSYATGDDGDLELGISKSYTVKTTGAQSGDVEVTVTGKTHVTSNATVKDNRTGQEWMREVIAADIGPAANGQLFWEQWTLAAKTDTSFDNASGEIRSAAAGFDTNALCAGRKFTVAGSTSNDGTYTVGSIAAGVITTVEGVVDEAASASITIATVGDLIWDLLDAVNLVAVGGYSDWRIPNYFELTPIVNLGNCNPSIDTTVFPSTPALYHWTASTYPCNSAEAFFVYFFNGRVSYSIKQTVKYYVRFVRG